MWQIRMHLRRSSVSETSQIWTAFLGWSHLYIGDNASPFYTPEQWCEREWVWAEGWRRAELSLDFSFSPVCFGCLTLNLYSLHNDSFRWALSEKLNEKNTSPAMDGKHTGLVKDITAPVLAKLSHMRPSDLPFSLWVQCGNASAQAGSCSDIYKTVFSVRQAWGYGHLTPSMKWRSSAGMLCGGGQAGRRRSLGGKFFGLQSLRLRLSCLTMDSTASREALSSPKPWAKANLLSKSPI